MRRNIPLPDDLEDEGLCYDLALARRVGLHEEMHATCDGREMTLSNTLFDFLLDRTDLAVNVEPYECQETTYTVGPYEYSLTYVYRYGRVAS